MADIRFTLDAANDLIQIKTYIAAESDSEKVADDMIQKILKRIKGLSDFPEIGAPLSAVINFDVPYRYLVCGGYTAFYRYENDTVSVIRILHSRRNYMRILFGDSEDKDSE